MRFMGVLGVFYGRCQVSGERRNRPCKVTPQMRRGRLGTRPTTRLFDKVGAAYYEFKLGWQNDSRSVDE